MSSASVFLTSTDSPDDSPPEYYGHNWTHPSVRYIWEKQNGWAESHLAQKQAQLTAQMENLMTALKYGDFLYLDGVVLSDLMEWIQDAEANPAIPFFDMGVPPDHCASLGPKVDAGSGHVYGDGDHVQCKPICERGSSEIQCFEIQVASLYLCQRQPEDSENTRSSAQAVDLSCWRELSLSEIKGMKKRYECWYKGRYPNGERAECESTDQLVFASTTGNLSTNGSTGETHENGSMVSGALPLLWHTRSQPLPPTEAMTYCKEEHTSFEDYKDTASGLSGLWRSCLASCLQSKDGTIKL